MSSIAYVSRFFYDLGYSSAVEKALLKFYGFGRVFQYHKKFEAQFALKYLREEKCGVVFDFGAGFLAQDNQQVRSKIKNYLMTTLVINVMPSRCLDSSFGLLDERLCRRIKEDPLMGLILSTDPEFDLNKTVVNHPFINEIVKMTYYQDEMSLQQIVEEIRGYFSA